MILSFAAFLKSAGKNPNYLQKIYILTGNGVIPVPRLENLNPTPITIQIFGGKEMRKFKLQKVYEKKFLTWHGPCHVTMYHCPQRATGRG